MNSHDLLFLLWPNANLRESKGKSKEKAVVEIEDDDNSSPKEEISGLNMPLLKLSLYVSFILITNILLVN